MEILCLNRTPVPNVIFEIIQFFDINFYLLKLEGIFRLAGDPALIKTLTDHLTFCDYSLLRGGEKSEMKEYPHVVSNVFKNILRTIQDPVCNYKLF
jgi:hypothetical protein